MQTAFDWTSRFVLCGIDGLIGFSMTSDMHMSRTMTWMSAFCRSMYQTLIFCLVCNVASYRCTSSATVNHATSIQLNALQCTWKYRYYANRLHKNNVYRSKLLCNV